MLKYWLIPIDIISIGWCLDIGILPTVILGLSAFSRRLCTLLSQLLLTKSIPLKQVLILLHRS